MGFSVDVPSGSGGSGRPVPPAAGALTVSLCILCHNRPEEVRAAVRSGVTEAWQEVIVLDMASDPPIEPFAGVKWLRSEANLGVAGGRNRLAEEAKGDVLVFLDDDAVFLTPPVRRLQATFGSDPSLGAVAFRVQREGVRDVPLEHPFRGRPAAPSQARDCAYFVGCGYAIRRDAQRSAGGYDERFFYSTEEVDLSFRLLRDGWRLRYEPQIAVEHRPSLRGRAASSGVPGWRLRNRLLLARAHLPTAVAAAHVGVWTFRTALEALRDRSLSRWWELGREGWSLPVDRRPLSWWRLLRAHRLGGRVLY